MNIIGRFLFIRDNLQLGFIRLFIILAGICYRLREERCDPDRPLPLDQKARDLSPRNGK